MDEPEEEEETILEYAEYHKLAYDSRANESLEAEICALQEFLEPLSLDDANLYEIPRKAPGFPEIRLTLDKDAAVLLRSVNQHRHREEPGPWAETATHRRCTRTKPKRLDLPLLKTDPEADFAAFKVRAQQAFKPEDEFLPAQPLDQENDEGLEWPSWTFSLSAKLMTELEMEKLTMSKEDVTLAMTVLRDDWGSEDDVKLMEDQLAYKRTTALDPISPPLSPVFFSDFEPFVPSSPGCILPLLSDPASLLSADQEAVEQRIFDEDNFTKNGSSSQPDLDTGDMVGESQHFHRSKHAFQELESLPSDEHFPIIDRHKKEDLQIDSGLTPPMPISTFPKSVTFSDHVDTMLLDEYTDEESSRAESRNSGIIGWGAEVEGALIAASVRVHHKLEGERLQEAAATKKVEVPALDFITPCPPWKDLYSVRTIKNIREYQQDFVADALNNNFVPAKVHGLHRLQETLRWIPFPTDLAKVALIEDLERSDALGSFLKTPANVTTSGDIIFKEDVLKCIEECDDDDDEEELEPAEYETPNEGQGDLDSLVRKRKRQLNIDADYGGHQAKQPKIDLQALKQSNPHKAPAAEMDDNVFGTLDFYSATSALDNFMEARGKKKPKLTNDYFSTSKRTPTPKQPLMHAAPAAPIAPTAQGVAIPLPTVIPSDNPTPFIVSTTVMQIRPVIKAIRSLYPTAQLIERDFSKHNESLWQRGTIKRSPVVSPLAAEADVILSPSTGVIMTTLAKIKQKPLPGQKTRAKHLDRIEAVAQRYARIIIFVSEGSADDSTRTLNGHDSMTLAELTGFCGAQECEILPVYVPGGPNALGTYIASAMVQHGIHDGSQASVMEDETVWEVFLRRCGMNAYAAQSVIAAIRAPEGVNSSSPNKAGMFGLPGFVQMDHVERVRLFETLFGGTRVLERVSTAIDTPWKPATPVMAQGFAQPSLYGHAARDSGFM